MCVFFSIKYRYNVLYTATNVAGISFAWPSSLEPQHSSFMFPVVLSNNLIYDLSLLTDMGVSQEIPEPYLALLLYTHPDPRALDSCQSVGMLSDRKHSSLILMETGIKKGLSAGGRVSCSVYSVEKKLHLMHYYFLTLPS